MPRKPVAPQPDTMIQYRCGHTRVYRKAGGGATKISTMPCFDCVVANGEAHTRARAEAEDAARLPDGSLPMWFRSGFANEADHAAFVQHDAEVLAGERARAEHIARINALPDAARPFRSTVLDGFGTLESLLTPDVED